MPMEAVIVIQGNKRVVRFDIPDHSVKMYVKNEATLTVELPIHTFLHFWEILQPVRLALEDVQGDLEDVRDGEEFSKSLPYPRCSKCGEDLIPNDGEVCGRCAKLATFVDEGE